MRMIRIHVGDCLLPGRRARFRLKSAWRSKAAKCCRSRDRPIENGIVLIRNGKIEAVGKDIAIPSDAKVIDATGKVVVPGFIEAHSNRGTDRSNETNPNVPFLSVVDAIDPSSDYFEECRRNGVTAAAIVPGNATMFGGQAAVVKTAGGYVDDMIVKRAAGIKISMRPSKIATAWDTSRSIRKALDDAREMVAEETKPATKPAGREENRTRNDRFGRRPTRSRRRAAATQQGNRAGRPGEAPTPPSSPRRSPSCSAAKCSPSSIANWRWTCRRRSSSSTITSSKACSCSARIATRR